MGYCVTEAGASALAQSETLASVETLHLDQNPLEGAGVKALA
ncbi:MAG: hypothetical protein ACI9WU_002766, partial [Myxococcota bacterium]